jgi:transcriptional regulator with GAF, ATPase, and Fis domain
MYPDFARDPQLLRSELVMVDGARRVELEGRATNGVLSGARGAAVRLGLKRTTLQSRMRKLGIQRQYK